MMNAMFEALDLKHLLLDHYKALGFQEKHVMVILVMDQFFIFRLRLQQFNSFVVWR